MTRPSLLFWKLFLAFWLATTLTFLVGIGVLELSVFARATCAWKPFWQRKPGRTERVGVDAAGQLLTVWERPPDENIGVYDSNGHFVRGVAR